MNGANGIDRPATGDRRRRGTWGAGLVLTACLYVIAASAQAGEPRYITDRLEVTLRTGHGNQYKILRMLPSGTPVEVLEEDAESGYSRVRLGSGIEGWVVSRYLDQQPSGRSRARKLGQEVERLRAELARVKAEAGRLDSGRSKLLARLDALQQENERLKSDLAEIRRTSANALALDDENRKLKRRLAELTQEHELVLQSNQSLKDRSARDWFLVGAGVILLGMIIGLIIPKIRWRRKSSWGSL